MLDLETLGTSPGCSILSIGATEFGPEGVRGGFYVVIQRQTCLNAGLVEDPGTLAWWSKQTPEARQILSEAVDPKLAVSLGMALFQFDFWLGQVATLGEPERQDLRIWGNGADFDQPILAQAYKQAGFNLPWQPRNARCYRTLKNLMPTIKLKRTGTHHNALADSQSQAAHAVELMKEVYEW
jgi:hypothetical protein